MKIFKKEKEVAVLALEYVETATHCVAAGRASVLAYLDGRLDEASAEQRKASDLETEADAERRKIRDVLFSGAYMPAMRGEISSVIETLDKVPNSSEDCCGFFVSTRPDVPDAFRESFVELTNTAFSVIDPLRKSVRNFFKPKGDIDKIREHNQAVSVCESDVDDLEWNLKKALFDSESLELARKQHLRLALERIAYISDVAENSAERLELAAMKSVL
jgi:predicted phosphate transport protein (TIGR00153 family)